MLVLFVGFVLRFGIVVVGWIGGLGKGALVVGL